MQVILQPCADRDAREHYNETIKNSINLDDIKAYISHSEYEDLLAIYPDKKVRVWGIVPGRGKSKNANKWNRIQSGDVTLLAAKKRIFASAISTYKVHNYELAKKLWGINQHGQTWEYIYFVSEIADRNVSYQELNKVIPYADNYVIQGFTILDAEKSDNVLNAFDFASEVFYPEVDIEKLSKEMEFSEKLVGASTLDIRSISYSRKEQAALRRLLFKNRPFANCCICEEKFPVGFLVAAHIKKRSSCAVAEKKDFYNIVAPMCKFGCDELYEKGIIGVDDDGVVVRLKNSKSTSKIENHIHSVIGRNCQYWTESSKQYFSWHVKSNLEI